MDGAHLIALANCLLSSRRQHVVCRPALDPPGLRLVGAEDGVVEDRFVKER